MLQAKEPSNMLQAKGLSCMLQLLADLDPFAGPPDGQCNGIHGGAARWVPP